MSTGQTLPVGRYPDESSASSRRRWLIILSVVVVAVGLGLAYVGYSKFADASVSGQGTGYQIVDNSTIDVQFTVTRDDPSKAVACVVRARSRDGSESGRREVLIPAGDSQQASLTSRLHTSSPPAVGEVFGCSETVPPYLTTDNK